MKYQIIKTTFMDIEQEHIIIHNEDGSFKSFPVSLDNPEYINFKEHIEQYEKVYEVVNNQLELSSLYKGE